MNTSQSAFCGARRLLASFLAAGFLLAGITGCSTTHQVSQTEKDFSGFLGDYSQLKPGKDGQANFVYINPTAAWKNYSKICIKPVALWTSDGDDSKISSLSKEDQQLLVNFLHTSLSTTLGKNFTLVDQAGPGVLVVRAAVTDANKSRAVMNVVSSIVPVSMVISASKRAITGKGSAVGSVSVEVELTDGVSDQRLAAAVDERAGTKALRTKLDGTWGDVKKSFDFWAEQLDTRLQSLKSGK